MSLSHHISHCTVRKCLMSKENITAVERGNQSELNPVDPIAIPTSVYCSPGGLSHVEEVRRVVERADECC